MAKLCFLLLVVALAVVAQTTTARDVPSETNKGVVGLTDQKNMFAFGGLGGFAGLGNNAQPVGGGGIGVGVGAGLGVGIGNDNGIGGAGGGVGTFGGIGGAGGDGPLP
ncbi:hypothetical protein Hanom_Chr15g01349991 [Helianthus anomalus]